MFAFLLCALMVGRERKREREREKEREGKMRGESYGLSFFSYKGANSIMGIKPKYLPKSLPPNTIKLEDRALTYEF